MLLDMLPRWSSHLAPRAQQLLHALVQCTIPHTPTSVSTSIATIDTITDSTTSNRDNEAKNLETSEDSVNIATVKLEPVEQMPDGVSVTDTDTHSDVSMFNDSAGMHSKDQRYAMRDASDIHTTTVSEHVIQQQQQQQQQSTQALANKLLNLTHEITNNSVSKPSAQQQTGIDVLFTGVCDMDVSCAYVCVRVRVRLCVYTCMYMCVHVKICIRQTAM
jgi:hypothetical protein